MLEEIDNKKVKVSKFTLLPNASTGFHIHTLDYVIIPISDKIFTYFVPASGFSCLRKT